MCLQRLTANVKRQLQCQKIEVLIPELLEIEVLIPQLSVITLSFGGHAKHLSAALCILLMD